MRLRRPDMDPRLAKAVVLVSSTFYITDHYLHYPAILIRLSKVHPRKVRQIPGGGRSRRSALCRPTTAEVGVLIRGVDRFGTRDSGGYMRLRAPSIQL